MKAFTLLGLLPTASPEEVKIRWRELANLNHPDKGGDADKFNELRTAYMEALEYSKKPKKCGNCNGSGSVARGHGFNTVKMRCEACNGRGQNK